MSTATTIPRFIAGTWTIDPVHSEISSSATRTCARLVPGRRDPPDDVLPLHRRPPGQHRYHRN